MSMDNDEDLTCPHFKPTVEIKKSLQKIAHHAAKVKGRCSVCHTQKSIWCCLLCYHIGCGRYEKKHALAHANKEEHWICVNMDSPTHLWCYKCDQPLMYFGDEDETNSNSNSNSNSSSNSPSNHRQTQRNRKPINNNIRNQLSVHPSKWKNAQSILKSTPIWSDSMNGGMCGMQNLGNTCFMNASLQALLHCPSVIYLFSLPEIMYVKRYNRVRMVEEFVRLTLQIWEGKHRCVIPKDLLRCVMYKFPQFRGYGQQDAHEFLTCLLDFLHEQFKYKIPIHKNDKNDKNNKNNEHKNNDNDDSDDEHKTNKKRKHYDETSIIHDLFSGETISQVQCMKCKTRSTKIDRITNISVEIPKQEQVDRAVKERNAKPLPQKGWMSSVFTFVGLQSQSIPLSLCLHSYCTSEDLLNTEKYHCDKCKSKQEAKKHLLISRLPEILMIQIKRFSHDSFWRGSSKVSTHVSFPINELDLSPYIDPKHKNDEENRDTVYDLSSIVKHMGSTGGGHYISYAKHPATGKWYKFDDSRVEEISPEKLIEQQAYILFYSRRKMDHSTIKSISSILNVANQLNVNNKKVLLSRYWLHKIHTFSRPGAIDNLWLSCYHGYPLKSTHDRRKYCSIKIPYKTWKELTKKYKLKYNAKILIHDDNQQNDKNDIVMVDKPQNNKNNKNNPTDDGMDVDNENDDDDVENDEKLMKSPSKTSFHWPWELAEKSEECDDCKLLEVNERREYEKREIRRLEDDACPQDCALSMKWANQWRNFVHNKTNIVPARIDNRHIHAGNHALKDELIKDTDYLLIPSNIWTFLIEIYGGGPKIVPIKKIKQQHQQQQNHKNKQYSPQQRSNRPPKPSKQAPQPKKQRNNNSNSTSPTSSSTQ